MRSARAVGDYSKEVDALTEAKSTRGGKATADWSAHDALPKATAARSAYRTALARNRSDVTFISSVIAAKASRPSAACTCLNRMLLHSMVLRADDMSNVEDFVEARIVGRRRTDLGVREGKEAVESEEWGY